MISRTRIDQREDITNQLIRKLVHVDPRDLPKLLSIVDSLGQKLAQDSYTRYDIEHHLLESDKSLKDLVNKTKVF